MSTSARVTRSSAAAKASDKVKNIKALPLETSSDNSKAAKAARKRSAESKTEDDLQDLPETSRNTDRKALAKKPRRTNGPSTSKSSPADDLPANAAVTDNALTSTGLLDVRPADAMATNAPLATPRGTRYVAYPLDQTPPSFLPPPRADTATLLHKACAHLCKVDPRMKKLIDEHPCPVFTPEALAEPVDPFNSLVRGILAQQVSGAAAASIRRKFIALFNTASLDASKHMFPSPAQVVSKDIATLRTAGLSQRKAEYVNGLAQKFVDGELSAELLAKSSWEEILERLTAVRGLGVWSVEMFGCFALKRMDIFSTGDLGVQRGMAAYLGKDVKKLRANGKGKWKYLSESEMRSTSAKFAPYRTLFMWYMWRADNTNIDAIQDH